MVKLKSLIALLVLLAEYVSCINNGLARTPPMGWMNWERFMCNVNCKEEPKDCISEVLFMEVADVLASEGYRDAGYEYVCIDDCWTAKERDEFGNLVADPERFPHGIKFLSDYMHDRGLKLGIYGDFGTKTCAGYPGSEYFLKQDADLFAKWEVDALKFDGCNSEVRLMDKGYQQMGYYLNMTGRPIQYSCSWPDYQRSEGTAPNYTLVADTCNLWRMYYDISDSYESILDIIDYYKNATNILQPVAGPGNWNDPDMLIIGNFGLSLDQARTQMAMWAILAAPLIMSNDPRKMRPEFKEILLNKKVIAVNQDSLGIQGKPIAIEHKETENFMFRPLQKIIGKRHNFEVWSRPINPPGSFAVAVMNRYDAGGARKFYATLLELGLKDPVGYQVQELFTGQDYGHLGPKDTFVEYVNPTGVTMITAVKE